MPDDPREPRDSGFPTEGFSGARPFAGLPDPERIGPYRILSKIGEGGMGVVYHAEQEEPIRRGVALKLIRAGLDSAQVIARFESERQALARMHHSNVATVLDAGTTEQGHPYFVMEYVDGVPVTQHCDTHHLSTRERLRLFMQICAGVQHAHQKGIIHRDLKPSNVLVAMEDGKPVPKIIDFGLAKATEQRLTERTLFTQMGALVGTPAYMSPEQADLNGEDVDTRTDVYSLGVLLYELLVGVLPFESEELRRGGLGEILRRIREEEPSRPSTRVNTLGGAATESARARRTDAASLARQIRGDLDWITMKALEKDRMRRYSSASELAEDIHRHLVDETVRASPPSIPYRIHKALRRNKGLFAALFTIMATLTIGLVVSTTLYWQADRARLDAEREAYVANVLAADSGLRLGSLSEAKRRLSECPPRLRGWEWHHLMLSADQSTIRFQGHEGRVSSLAFTPDGTRLISGGTEAVVRVWDVATMDEPRLLVGHEGPVNGIAVAPDGTVVVTGSDDKTARVWDLDSGDERFALRGHSLPITAVSFSPDANRIATGSVDNRFRVWDAHSGVQLLVVQATGGPVQSLAFSPDGERIATGNGAFVQVWNARNGELESKYEHDSWMAIVGFKDDHTVLFAGERLHSWRYEMADNPQPFHDVNVTKLALGPHSDRIATVSYGLPRETTIDVWDLETMTLELKLSGHDRPVTSVVFSPSGTDIASGSEDGTIRFWDLSQSRTSTTLEFQDALPRWSGGTTRNMATGSVSLGFAGDISPDGSLVAAADWQDITIWNTASSRLMMTLKTTLEKRTAKHTPPRVASLAFSPDGTKIAGADFKGTTSTWNVAGGRLLDTWSAHDGPVTSITFSPDGSLIGTGSYDRTARIWDAASGRLVTSLSGHVDEVTSVAFGPAGAWVVSGSRDKSVRLWDGSTGASLVELEGHREAVLSVAVSPDGALVASGSADKTVRVWNLSGEVLLELFGHDAAVTWVTWNEDGSRLISGSLDQTVRLWDLDTGATVLTLPIGQDGDRTQWVTSTRFTPDGKRLVSLSDRSLRVWMAATREP